MLEAYDISVKKLIGIFANKIPVVGLQNDDNTENSESVMTRSETAPGSGISSFPVISVFRGPEINITDGSITKRSSTYQGYSVKTPRGLAHLVAMRGNLHYTVDVFDTTRASAEKIALQLYFRLRNNPQIDVKFDFKDFEYQAECSADIQMEEDISHQKVNSASSAQVYKIRIGFTLSNVNLYDLIGDRELITNIGYSIEVKMDEADVGYQE